MDDKVREALDRLFYPRTVAVFGSAREGKIAHQIVTQLTRGGYAGRVVVVNPRAEPPEGFPGVQAFATGCEVDGRVDLAVLALPAQFAEAAVRESGAAGARVAVVITAGFAEVGNIDQERRLLSAARQSGVRLIGPNCAGIMNSANSLMASIEVRARPGRAAFITQSGAIGGAVLGLADTRGVGFSKFVSYGNRADLGETELLEYLAADPETDVIAVYFESVTDGARLLPVLAAVAEAKPLIAVKAGRTSTGQRAASSHTGSLAGDDAVYAAAFRKAAVVRAAGIEEMLDLCEAFTRLRPPAGRRLAIVTNSGGPGILAADHAEELGLQVAEPSAGLRSTLRELLSERCGLGNPVDLTVEATGSNFERALRLMLHDEYDAALAVNVATPFLDSRALARAVIAARDALPSKPIAAVFAAGTVVAESVDVLQQAGVPCFPTGERAVLAIARLRDREDMLADARRARTVPRQAARDPGGPGAQLPRGSHHPLSSVSTLPIAGLVLEPDGWSFLCGRGFPFPAHRFCHSREEAARATSDSSSVLRFPLVMKVVSPEVTHKSDRGGVMVGLQETAAVTRAFDEMAARFAGASFRGVLLAEQVTGGLEVIVGIKRDPVFGPVVLAGLGGVWTEVLHDAAVRLAPVDDEEALGMLGQLRSAPLLSGIRGSAPRDTRALAGLIARISLLAVEHPEIAELDLNPVSVLPEGQGALIVDVRIITAPVP